VRTRTWEEFVTYFRSRLRVSERTWNGTPCLEWTGAIGKHGYGNIRYDRNGVCWHKPHRLAWIIARGEIPEGMSVLHHCDNKPCANDGHLFLGTAKDNHDDMRSKQRASNPPRCVGSQHPEAKLNECQVASIKRARARGVHVKVLAEKYGVAHQLISRIARGESWLHVPGSITKTAASERQLDEQSVISIRLARASGIRLKEIAAQYAISPKTVSKIVRGEHWGHVAGPITKCTQGARL
jgi:hypothetical protein